VCTNVFERFYFIEENQRSVAGYFKARLLTAEMRYFLLKNFHPNKKKILYS
jgi:hypothetical protein